jgi:DNA-binding NtrC family response regulator
MHQNKILLVDDNALQATVRRTILERNGYTVIAALHPVKAIEHLQNSKQPDVIDLVITDHIMPGMNGSAFVREIRSIMPELPVLVISGMEDACGEYQDLNVEFRTKPLQPDLLLKCVWDLMRSTNSGSRLEAIPTPASA